MGTMHMQTMYGREQMDHPEPNGNHTNEYERTNARILLVEDYATTRLMITHLLRCAGYQVTTASDGETAINMLQNEQFDVAIVDIILGDVDGIEVLHVAKQQPYNPQVILLTGCGTLETCMAALRYGAYDYLLKPCADDNLLQCIESARNKHTAEQQIKRAIHTLSTVFTSELPAPSYETTTPNPAAPPADTTESVTNSSPPTTTEPPPHTNHLVIGSLVIGTTRYKVWFKNEQLPITPIEYSLLFLLAQTPGQARHYWEIVWHTHQLKTNNTEAQGLLRSHVRNLRKKLDPGYLVNERGVGYKLVDPNA